MKKVLLTAAAVFAFGFADAQETKETSAGFKNGDIFISGTAKISSRENGFDNSLGGYKNINEVLFAPKVGFFVSDNLVFGLGLGFGSLNLKESSFERDDIKRNSTILSVFGRYYATPTSKFSLFGQFEFQNTLIKYVDEEDVKVNGFGLGLSPGISYFLNKHFALEATFGYLGYSSEKGDYDGAVASNNFNLSLDLSAVNFGIVYKF